MQDLMGALIAIGADISIVHEGLTSLHVACLRGWEKCAYFLAHKAEAKGLVDARGPGGQTPLHLAARMNQSEIVSFLLMYGADRDIRDYIGETPLDKANRWGCEAAAERLMEERGRKRKNSQEGNSTIAAATK